MHAKGPDPAPAPGAPLYPPWSRGPAPGRRPGWHRTPAAAYDARGSARARSHRRARPAGALPRRRAPRWAPTRPGNAPDLGSGRGPAAAAARSTAPRAHLVAQLVGVALIDRLRREQEGLDGRHFGSGTGGSRTTGVQASVQAGLQLLSVRCGEGRVARGRAAQPAARPFVWARRGRWTVLPPTLETPEPRVVRRGPQGTRWQKGRSSAGLQPARLPARLSRLAGQAVRPRGPAWAAQPSPALPRPQPCCCRCPPAALVPARPAQQAPCQRPPSGSGRGAEAGGRQRPGSPRGDDGQYPALPHMRGAMCRCDGCSAWTEQNARIAVEGARRRRQRSSGRAAASARYGQLALSWN
jgi:hypothetical protein